MVIIKYFLNQGNEFIKPKLQSELFGYARKELICCKHTYFQALLRIHFPPVFFHASCMPSSTARGRTAGLLALSVALFELASSS